MISNQATAAILFQSAFDAYCGVDAALSKIAGELSPEELAACKLAAGKVMGTILIEITEPILRVHPELLPDGWREQNRKSG